MSLLFNFHYLCSLIFYFLTPTGFQLRDGQLQADVWGPPVSRQLCQFLDQLRGAQTPRPHPAWPALSCHGNDAESNSEFVTSQRERSEDVKVTGSLCIPLVSPFSLDPRLSIRPLVWWPVLPPRPHCYTSRQTTKVDWGGRMKSITTAACFPLDYGWRMS